GLGATDDVGDLAWRVGPEATDLMTVDRRAAGQVAVWHERVAGAEPLEDVAGARGDVGHGRGLSDWAFSDWVIVVWSNSRPARVSRRSAKAMSSCLTKPPPAR